MDIYEMILIIILILEFIALIVVVVMPRSFKDDNSNKPEEQPIETSDISNLPPMTQFEYGKMQLDFIDEVVSTLIEIKIANYALLGQTYSTLHLDGDIAALAAEARDAFQAKFFDEKKSMYKNSYLYKYMIEKCKIGLIQASKR